MSVEEGLGIDLKKRLFELEPKIDLLHECLGFGQYGEMTITSDGFFLGQARGDIGFNYFLGCPSEVARERTAGLFAKLTEEEQLAVRILLMRQGISPEKIGIKAD